MDAPIAVSEDTYWVGVNDRETDLFESIWPLPRGVSYNSYVITGDHPVVIDTVKRTAFGTTLFPPMQAFIDLIEEKRLQDRLLGIFGTYGWSRGAVKTLTAFAQRAKYDAIEPVVEARFSPEADDIEHCHALGRAMARAVRGDA